MFRLQNSHKLATKEDPYHLHKLLGAVCLVHFGYRYYLLFSRGNMDLDNTTAAVFVGIHGALSCSSLIFHIPGVRNKTAPMIYPEYRLHSILFVLRSVVCYFCVYNQFSIVYRFAACYSTMILADIVTSTYNKDGSRTTTMRDMPFDKRIGEEEQRQITMMQSSQQIGATLYMVGNLESCFSPMLAIQLAALLMTLVRKSIIDSNAWHLIYNLSLWINAFCFYSLPIEYVLIQPVLYFAFYYWRFSFGRTPPNIFYGNKYVGWTFVFLAFYMQEHHIGLFPDKKIANILLYYNLDWTVRSLLIIGYLATQINNCKGLLRVIFLPGSCSSSQDTHLRTD